MVTIKVVDEQDSVRLYLSSDTPTKPIAGHRFVDLLGKNQFINKNDLILDLYGLKYVPENIYMTLGKTLEEPVIKYKFPDDEIMRFEYDDYRECRSGAFDLDDEDIGGLPDGIIKDKNLLLEVKCTTGKFKGFKDEWRLQAQFYAYWWNKNRGIKENCIIDKVCVVKYYVPKDILEAHIKYPNWIVSKNLSVETYDLDTEEIELLINKARENKELLINDSSIKVDLDFPDSTIMFQLKKAYNAKKVVFEYDKSNENQKRFMSILYHTKVGRKKKRVKKGLKKI